MNKRQSKKILKRVIREIPSSRKKGVSITVKFSSVKRRVSIQRKKNYE